MVRGGNASTARLVGVEAESRLGPAGRFGLRIVFAAWLATGLLLGAALLAGHLLALPTPPASDPTLAGAIAAGRRADQPAGWLAVHILYEDCGCSQRILEHLLTDPRPAWLTDRIVVVADDGRGEPALRTRLEAGSAAFEILAPAALEARYHVAAAPLLAIADPAGTLRYVGGYTARKQAADVRDLQIADTLRAGGAVEPLPTFGCAISRELAGQLDPFGLRNWK